MKDVWKDQLGELTPELLSDKTDEALADMKDYLELIMEQRKSDDIDDQQFTKAFMTAMIKTASLELFRRALDEGKMGYDLMTDMMAQISLELIMKSMLGSKSPLDGILEMMVDEHNCETCPKKDACPQEKQDEINTLKAKILLKKEKSSGRPN